MYLAQFMYISLLPQNLGGEKKKRDSVQLPFFLANSCVIRGGKTSSRKSNNYNRGDAKLSAKFHYIVIAHICGKNDFAEESKILLDTDLKIILLNS